MAKLSVFGAKALEFYHFICTRYVRSCGGLYMVARVVDVKTRLVNIGRTVLVGWLRRLFMAEAFHFLLDCADFMLVYIGIV